MRQARVVKARVEHAHLFVDHSKASSPSKLDLWCQMPCGRYFETFISFSLNGSGAARQRLGLVEHLVRCQGLGVGAGWSSDFRCLNGRYFAFQLLELRPRVLVIEKAKAIEPFSFAAPDDDALRELMEAADVR